MRAYRKLKVFVSQEDRGNSENCNKQTYKAVYKLSVPVHEEYYDQCREQQAAKNCRPQVYNTVKMPEHKQVEKCIQCLNNRVSWRDFSPAGMTLSFKTAPADYRDKITLPDFGSAGHTVRIALDKAFIKRQSVNAHVKKASYTSTENKYKHIND